jgi:hypothetical protein
MRNYLDLMGKVALTFLVDHERKLTHEVIRKLVMN